MISVPRMAAMRKTAARMIGFVVAVVAGTLVAPAQSGKVQTPSKGIAARSVEVDAKVDDLTRNIAWHTSLADAQAAAKKIRQADLLDAHARRPDGHDLKRRPESESRVALGTTDARDAREGLRLRLARHLRRAVERSFGPLRGRRRRGLDDERRRSAQHTVVRARARRHGTALPAGLLGVARSRRGALASAKSLRRVWRDPSLSRAQKDARFRSHESRPREGALARDGATERDAGLRQEVRERRAARLRLPPREDSIPSPLPAAQGRRVQDDRPDRPRAHGGAAVRSVSRVRRRARSPTTGARSTTRSRRTSRTCFRRAARRARRERAALSRSRGVPPDGSGCPEPCKRGAPRDPMP